VERVGGEEDSGDAVVAARGSDGSDDMHVRGGEGATAGVEEQLWHVA